jgi:hypothetical protein
MFDARRPLGGFFSCCRDGGIGGVRSNTSHHDA